MLIRIAAAALAVTSGIALPLPAAAQSHQGMAAHVAMPARPAKLDTSLDRPSDRGLYRVRIASLAQPVPLNRIHSWSVEVERNGRPVEGATVTADGGMPEHGHGFPTALRTGLDAQGGHVIDGVKFSMRGWWEIKLDIRSPAGTDQVTFNVVL